MNIAVVGSGYVGLVAGACFAESGNDVVCVDVDTQKIEKLKRGIIPIYEPGLEDIVKRNLRQGRLQFTESIQAGVEASEIIFIAVGTPSREDGSSDLRYVVEVAESIGRFMNGPKIVVNKSTVPVGTAAAVRGIIAGLTAHEFEVVSNPEFLKEGAAIEDFTKPDRVVIGASSARAAEVMKELYSPFVRTNKPILIMDVTSAEMTKYAANTMLATRVTFMNELANLCERLGADIEHVRKGIGTDSRIGMDFLFPGVGYGGSCFPKDVQSIIHTARQAGFEFKIAQAVEDANARQKKLLVQKVVAHCGPELAGKTFAVWGLAFKAKTDDVRESPALTVCRGLLERGASLRAFDPEAMENFRKAIGDSDRIRYAANSYEAIEQADALLVCTEWSEFRRPNFDRMKRLLRAPVVFDGRNIYDPAKMKEMGFVYFGVGRRQPDDGGRTK
jgi:UDPglucose 6-dehydrogenase